LCGRFSIPTILFKIPVDNNIRTSTIPTQKKIRTINRIRQDPRQAFTYQASTSKKGYYRSKLDTYLEGIWIEFRVARTRFPQVSNRLRKFLRSSEEPPNELVSNKHSEHGGAWTNDPTSQTLEEQIWRLRHFPQSTTAYV
jgi:hypothetical protein